MSNLFFRVWAYETLNCSFSLWKKKQQQKNKNKRNNNNSLLIGVVDSLIHEAAISANYTSFYTLKYFFIMFFVSILDDTRKRDEK